MGSADSREPVAAKRNLRTTYAEAVQVSGGTNHRKAAGKRNTNSDTPQGVNKRQLVVNNGKDAQCAPLVSLTAAMMAGMMS
jgi:hypothetical protein